MAASDNFGTSALLGFQGRMAKGLTQWETRELDTMALYYALENTQFFEELYDVKTVKQSVQRPLYAYAFNRITTANGSGMTSFPTGGQGTTAQIALSFVSLTQNFSTWNVNGLDNVMDFDAIFANAATQAMRQIRTGLREAITQFLYTNRTTYGIPTLKGATFNATTNAFEIGSPQPYSVMTSIMRQNSYNESEYDLFMDSNLYQNYLFSQAQGVGNATNLAYQFAPTTVTPGVGQIGNTWEDINLGTTIATPSGYTTGTCLMMPRRSFAFVPWMPALYYDPSVNKEVNSMDAFSDYAGGYGTIGDNKYRNLQYMLFGWRTQSDTSSSNGYAQSQTQQWQIGVNFAMVTAYLSNAGETPIYFMALSGS
jgi:hypothetical protein